MSRIKLDTQGMVSGLHEAFQSDIRHVTMKQLAHCYGALIAQHEAMLAVYALAGKANPSLIFTDEMSAARNAIEASADTLGAALLGIVEDDPDGEHEDEK